MKSTRLLYLGLGGNIGLTKRYILAALGGIEHYKLAKIERLSSYWLTKPWGNVKQNDFTNAVASGTTDLEAHTLLCQLKEIEEQLGRREGERYGPRIIDLDILTLGEVSLNDDLITIPHREILNRVFVLAPLLELEPDITINGISAKEQLKTLNKSLAKKTHSSEGWRSHIKEEWNNLSTFDKVENMQSKRNIQLGKTVK